MSELQPQPAFPGAAPQKSSSAAFVYLTLRNILLRREQAAPPLFSSILDVAAQTSKLRATEARIDARIQSGQTRIVQG
jgi:hypothetical protein